MRISSENSRNRNLYVRSSEIGHDKSNLIGSLLVTQFQLAAMARARMHEDERRDFHRLVDEFHNFATDSFASILSEARKYHLNLVICHQYVEQLSPIIRQSVFGNVGTLVAFRTGYADAEVLAKEFANEFHADQLVDLDRHEVVVKLLENGLNATPFRAKTLGPLHNRVGRKEKLIARSRERFASHRPEVEARLARWMAG